jgi:hypothetical protein
MTSGAATPVPVSEAVCGEPAALSVTLKVAVREPDAVGRNTTDIRQLEPAARLDPQLFVSEKSPAFAPVMPIEDNARAAVPTLLRVADWAELEAPIVVFPKLRPAVRLAAGA